MDYEKKYKEALERFKTFREKYCTYGELHFGDVIFDKTGEAQKDLDAIFPELAESEDEKIRKEINILYSDIDTCISELLKARTDKDSEAEGKALFKMEGLMVATLQDLSCIEDYLEKQKEQKPAEWSEEDEEMISNIISSLRGYMCLASKSPYYTNHEAHIQKEIEFLNTLPERFALQPKQEWSEEDEDKLYQIIETLLADKEIACRDNPQHYDVLCKAYDEQIAWLKSLRPSWKPSEEQMEMLAMFANLRCASRHEADILESLYNNLKKRM